MNFLEISQLPGSVEEFFLWTEQLEIIVSEQRLPGPFGCGQYRNEQQPQLPLRAEIVILLHIIIGLETDFHRQRTDLDQRVTTHADGKTEFICFPVVLDIGTHADIRFGREAITEDVLKIREVHIGTLDLYRA